MFKPLSKNKFRFYHKLNQKKYRDKEELYIISGLRCVEQALLNDFSNCIEIIIDSNKTDFLLNLETKQLEISSVSTKDFQALNEEQNPQGICIVAKKPKTIFNINTIDNTQIIFLDCISDPGNLGTILRSAVWFGIKSILLSPNSADPFQPKVVRASSGAINSINIYENAGTSEIEELKSGKGYKIFATDVSKGKSISSMVFKKSSLFMLGSEAHGLAGKYEKLCDEKIVIKKTGNGESLNLANAASIIMYQASKTL